ncbi:hypothetical protein SAMN05444273_101216 [Litoreibacter ascidiaceicola]|uniref:Uncharacterized protein n=1 Tax=Litoreibacter ascidiaceicola TaxID=1486859 RepID=A0A1M4SX52_9RHOB|nr:hypothetical protein [Litoreibacter ascidiaceicola]SHE36587.1 hypothetical protein SAMN05444273_101216 [Litoreibacter ascidiaceicola]
MPEPEEPKGQGRRRIGLTATSPNSRTLFLERRVYQRRRLIDAAKLLPIVGLFLFVVPALILGTPGEENATGTTALRLIYFFFVWACLIATCATIARGLAGVDHPAGDKDKADEDQA